VGDDNTINVRYSQLSWEERRRMNDPNFNGVLRRGDKLVHVMNDTMNLRSYLNTYPDDVAPPSIIVGDERRTVNVSGMPPYDYEAMDKFRRANPDPGWPEDVEPYDPLVDGPYGWAEGVYEYDDTSEDVGGVIPNLPSDEERRNELPYYVVAPTEKQEKLYGQTYGFNDSDDAKAYTFHPIGVEQLRKTMDEFGQRYDEHRRNVLRTMFNDNSWPVHVPIVLPLHRRLWNAVTLPFRRLSWALNRARMAFHDDNYDGPDDFNGYDRGW
jgi:hypothetical protein